MIFQLFNVIVKQNFKLSFDFGQYWKNSFVHDSLNVTLETSNLLLVLTVL